MELLEKQRELAEKDQTMIVMKEQLGLEEKKLRGNSDRGEGERHQGGKAGGGAVLPGG